MQAKTKRVKYVMTYIKENTNMNEHRKVIVKLNNKNISKSAYHVEGGLRYNSGVVEGGTQPPSSTIF